MQTVDAHSVPGTTDRWTRRGVTRMALALVLLLAIVLAGDRLGGAVLDRLVSDSQYRMARVERGDVDADVVFVGNSRAVNGFHPSSVERATGARAFNLATNRMSMGLVDAMVRDYLDKNPAPKMIVFEVSNVIARELDTKTVVSSFRPFMRHSARLRRLVRDEAGFDARVCGWFHISCFNSELTLRALVHLRGSDQEEGLHGRFDGTLSGRLSEIDAHVDEREAILLRDLVRDVGRRGVATRLVVTPVPEPMRRLRATLPAAERRLEEIVGARVFDYSRAVDRDGLFHDALHLNVDGAAALLHDMQRDGFYAPVQREGG